jgi:hydroxymethylbilane synthase
MLPAVGQGALGIEARADDAEAIAVLALLDHRPSRAAVMAERTLLAALAGGCLAPIGALAIATSDRLQLKAAVCSVDGVVKLEASDELPLDRPETLGQRVAEGLLSQGAAKLIQTGRDLS